MTLCELRPNLRHQTSVCLHRQENEWKHVSFCAQLVTEDKWLCLKNLKSPFTIFLDTDGCTHHVSPSVTWDLFHRRNSPRVSLRFQYRFMMSDSLNVLLNTTRPIIHINLSMPTFGTWRPIYVKRTAYNSVWQRGQSGGADFISIENRPLNHKEEWYFIRVTTLNKKICAHLNSNGWRDSLFLRLQTYCRCSVTENPTQHWLWFVYAAYVSECQ